MTVFKTLAIFLTIAITSCCSLTKTTKASSESDIEKLQQNDKLFLEQGYIKGTIVYSDIKGDCEYTILVESTGTLFDPINLENNFKKDAIKIWFTYNGLRMMNRCEKANPIRIDSIHMRME